ncbi:uncharacterized protein LOC144127633 [Amblyomma americanum]
MFSGGKTSSVTPSRRGPCCCVPGCSLRPGTNLLSQVRTFRFPADAERRNAWIAAVRRDRWMPTKSSHVCSAHFVQGENRFMMSACAAANSCTSYVRFEIEQRKVCNHTKEPLVFLPFPREVLGNIALVHFSQFFFGFFLHLGVHMWLLIFKHSFLSLGKPSSDPTHPDYVPSIFPYRASGNVAQKISRTRRG